MKSMNKIFPTEWIFPKAPKAQREIHLMSVKNLEKKFNVDVTKGLSSSQVKELVEKNGKNQLSVSYLGVFKAVFLGLIDYFSLILWSTLIVFVLLFQLFGDLDNNSLVIAIIVFICLVVKSCLICVQEYNSIKIMRQLQVMNSALVRVLRDSIWTKIAASELVVGDVIEIGPNENVPADIRLISVDNLRLDKSILTGESEPIEGILNHLENIETKVSYYEAKNMAFRNFSVVNGFGKGIVVSVNNQNYIANDVVKRGQDHISRGLSHLALSIVLLSIFSAILYLIVWISILRLSYTWTWNGVVYATLSVAFVGMPVGLPVSLTAGLYLVLRRLRKSHVFVKNIFSILLTNNIDVVLTDKTGTLTRNSLEVASVLYSTNEIDVDDVYMSGKVALEQLLDLCDFCTQESGSFNLMEQALFEFAQKNRPPGMKKLVEEFQVVDQIEFNNSIKYNIYLNQSLAPKKSGMDLLGTHTKTQSQYSMNTKNPSILGIPKNMNIGLDLGYSLSIEFESGYEHSAKIGCWVGMPKPIPDFFGYQVKLVKEREEKHIYMRYDNIFNMNTTRTLNNFNFEIVYTLMVRGAPDFLLPKCKFILDDDGNELKMSDDNRYQIETKINQWSLMGRRLMIFCKKTFTDEKLDNDHMKYNRDFEKWFELECNDLVFVGLIGFIDPPKPDVHSTVEKIRKMGVRVVMVTGDYSVTAASIAASIGILSDGMRYDTFTKFREGKAAVISFKNNNNKFPSSSSPPSVAVSVTSVATGATSFSPRHSILLNGQEIDRLTRDEWKRICTDYNEIILSRATPNHKLRCVKEFQSSGHSVLAVGDGVNDVPALKQANLSVAMSSGSKIASDMAHVVLLDSVFGGVYALLTSGRQVLLNIKKSILISIISSVCSQYVVILLTNTIGIPQLYSDLQMVVVNTVVNIIASFSLFLDPAETKDLKDINEKLFDRSLIAMGLFFLGPLTTIFAYVNYFIYFKIYNDLNPSDLVNKYFMDEQTTPAVRTAQSISFYSIVIMQLLGNLYSIRMRRLTVFETLPFAGAYRNWFLSVSTVVCFLLVIVLVTFPLPGFTVQIPFAFYPVPLIFVVLILFFNEFRKWILARSS